VTDPELGPPTGRKRAVFFLVLIVIALGLLELGSFTVIAVLTRKGWMAYIPALTPAQIAVYLRERDRTIGWAYLTDSTWGSATDSSGRIARAVFRADPAPSASGKPCVSVYGDSFAYGTEAANDATYPHFLSELLQCPVRNFGVPGFGSDQALMLFRAQADVDSAGIVVFQHVTENILRNVNRYANLLYPGSPLRFKPRFVVDREDVITYVPSPVESVNDFARLRANPDSALRPDALLERPRASFPFTISLLRWLAKDVKLRARFTGEPIELNFYGPKHPAGGLTVSAAILETAVRDAAARNKEGVVFLQSTRQALIYARETGRWIDQSLYDTLHARGVPVIHGGPKILAAIDGADPCTLFEGCTQTHMNAAGNRIVAGIIADFLHDAGVVPSAMTSATPVP
jgi:hypothetical protein